jgi:Flp pilus assembly CpaE family ATPase
MIEYGTVIYEGQQVRSKDKQPCKYILKDNWLVVVNPKDNLVITLFKIDLGAGDEMNKQYIQTMLNKLNAAKEKVDEKISILKTLTNSYQDAIIQNNELIQDYKNKIKSLEEQNNCLNKLLQEEQDNKYIAEEEIRDIVAIMTTGTKF